jgi:hypothetical protein
MGPPSFQPKNPTQLIRIPSVVEIQSIAQTDAFMRISSFDPRSVISNPSKMFDATQKGTPYLAKELEHLSHQFQIFNRNDHLPSEDGVSLLRRSHSKLQSNMDLSDPDLAGPATERSGDYPGPGSHHLAGESGPEIMV